MQLNKKLKIGIFLKDEKSVPFWVYSMLEKIRNLNYVDIELVIVPNKIIKNSDTQNPFSYNFYQKIDNRFFFNKCNALHLTDATKLLGDIPKLEFDKNENQFYASDEVLHNLQNYELDVLFSVNYEKMDKKILDNVRAGYWFFVFDGNYSDPNLDGFWSVFERNPVTESNLCMMSGSKISKLFSSFSSTDTKSAIRNRNQLYWKGSLFLPRLLGALHKKGISEFMKSFEKNLDATEQRRYGKITNAYVISGLVSIFKRYSSLRFRNAFCFDQWMLMFGFEVGIPDSKTKLQFLIPPKDRFWADPMIVQKENSYYVFIEEFLYKNKKGHISIFEINEKTQSSPKMILDRPYHLSYPFVFSYDNNYYMIPESSANKTIELYKCIEFPEKWEFSKNLMENVIAVDSTLFYKDGKWWLFVNMAENKNSSTWDELFLFYSEDPTSTNWIPHPQNPIVSDVRNARPAGRIFEQDGNIYRPSQDNSAGYGSRLIINQILLMNENDYREKQVQVIEPSWDAKLNAVHTIDFQNKLTVLDAKIQRKR